MAFLGMAQLGVPLCALSLLKARWLLREIERVGQGSLACHRFPPLQSLSLSRSNGESGGRAGGKSNLHADCQRPLQGPGTNSEIKHICIQWPHLPPPQCPPFSSWCPFLPQLPFRIWTPSLLFALPSVQTLTDRSHGGWR